MELPVLPLLALALALPAGVLASSQYQLAVDAGVPFPPHNYHMSSAPASPWSLPLDSLQNFTTSQSRLGDFCFSSEECRFVVEGSDDNHRAANDNRRVANDNRRVANNHCAPNNHCAANNHDCTANDHRVANNS
ncbi:hypothetical protein FJT64_004387 [Amphibalanus amphitrite]|uniref:Uncharacterized protein n=1 Tax=Amphibalanus amphitrite TaxID=1232801 RepID=A0A6A4W8M8_AMPAM|nr:hypothetical protein FJT64_004387 [Amphibalanus amphitrite]